MGNMKQWGEYFNGPADPAALEACRDRIEGVMVDHSTSFETGFDGGTQGATCHCQSGEYSSRKHDEINEFW